MGSIASMCPNLIVPSALPVASQRDQRRTTPLAFAELTSEVVGVAKGLRAKPAVVAAGAWCLSRLNFPTPDQSAHGPCHTAGLPGSAAVIGFIGVVTARSGAHTASLRVRRHPALGVLERDQRRAAARPVLFPSGQSGGRKGSQP